MKQKTEYSPVTEEDVEGREGLLHNATGDEEAHVREPTSKRANPSQTLTNYRAILLGVVIGFTISFMAAAAFKFLQPEDTCTKKMAVWSPALDIYRDDDFELQRFNGALRDPNKFRGPPSPEIDQAWNELLYPEGGLVRLSKDELKKINASEYAAAYTDEMGGGYMAGIEVLHQLHCVNMLRQATFMDYYLPINKEWEDRKTLRYHLDHCVDMLRQKLMCDPDVGMVTYVWAKGWKQAFPDFNTMHKCRNYNKVLDWAHENWVHNKSMVDIKRAPGALERDTRP